MYAHRSLEPKQAKHNQDVIRELNPDPKNATQGLIHCRLLKRNPFACNDIPVGDGKRGMCPKNPHHPDNVAKREALKAEFEKQFPTIIPESITKNLERIGESYSAAIKMGLITSLSQLSPMEFILATNQYFVSENKRTESSARLQAKLIISELATLLGKGRK